MNITKKDIGKRVKVHGFYNGQRFKHEMGKIIYPFTNSVFDLVGIEFDKRKDGFHSCRGAGKPGHCFNVPTDMVRNVKQPKTKHKEYKKKHKHGIRIKTQKVINDKGEQCRKIISVDALPKHKLPKMYINSNNEVVYRSTEHRKGLVCSYKIMHVFKYCGISDILSENNYQELLLFCKAAGENLRRINEELKELKQEWNGEETVII